MKIVIVSIAVLAVVASASARTWHVRPDGTGDVPTIQSGADSCASGDTLLLADGIYRGTGNYSINLPDRNMLIMSETGDPASCIVDCEGPLGGTRYAFGPLRAGHTLSGVTITNANACAVRAEGGTLTNCVFSGNYNTGEDGAPPYPYLGCGGAVFSGVFSYYQELTITNCTFVGNRAWDGGAIYFSGFGLSSSVTGCTFVDNRAELGGSGGGGGGAIWVSAMGLTAIESCIFHDNSAAVGGAILACATCEWGVGVGHSLFYRNCASVRGGAIAVSNMSFSIGGCTIVANSAPDGSGISAPMTPIGVQSSIVAYNRGGAGCASSENYEGYLPSLECTDIFGNEGGDWVGDIAPQNGTYGNISLCPGFCGADGNDYRLCDTSPCLPGDHGGYACGLIGALGQGCACGASATQPATWGAIKAMYK